MEKIVFKNEDNSVGVIIPSQEALSFATMIQIAEKDVPHPLPYKIVDESVIPTDRTFRDAWEWDMTIEPDGFGGVDNTFDDALLAKYKG